MVIQTWGRGIKDRDKAWIWHEYSIDLHNELCIIPKVPACSNPPHHHTLRSLPKRRREDRRVVNQIFRITLPLSLQVCAMFVEEIRTAVVVVVVVVVVVSNQTACGYQLHMRNKCSCETACGYPNPHTRQRSSKNRMWLSKSTHSNVRINRMWLSKSTYATKFV